MSERRRIIIITDLSGLTVQEFTGTFPALTSEQAAVVGDWESGFQVDRQNERELRRSAEALLFPEDSTGNYS